LKYDNYYSNKKICKFADYFIWAWPF